MKRYARTRIWAAHHRDMLERLTLADLVVADMTQSNGNVYYEVGIRHGAKEAGCVLISAEWSKTAVRRGADAADPLRVAGKRNLRRRCQGRHRMLKREIPSTPRRRLHRPYGSGFRSWMRRSAVFPQSGRELVEVPG